MVKKIQFPILFVLVFLIQLSFAGTIQLPRTGQTKCYDTTGTEINCTGTGQDGEILAGVAWPVPRFTVTYCETNGPCSAQSSDCDANVSTDVVTDNLTGLMWAMNGNLNGAMTWYQAIDNANNLNLCGYSDWRLPNINELESLINAAEPDTATWINTQGFSNVQLGGYWSSTTGSYNIDGAWVVHMWSGSVYYFDKDYYVYDFCVLPVRAGQSGNPDPSYPANIWKTGQTTSYATEDDGDKERGVDWPNPRFSDQGNGTIADNLTGLTWTKDANVPGPSICSPGISKTWQGALDYVACLNTNSYLGYNDWRLPNRKELRSLVDYSNYCPALPSSHPFTSVQVGGYWSSTTGFSTSSYDTRYAWVIDMCYGVLYGNIKGSSSYVWPVRGGQVGQMSFPIEGYTPYSARVTSVLDHSVFTHNPIKFYTKDSVIEAFNGETGDRKCKNIYITPTYSIKGCKNESGTRFLNGVLNYTGGGEPRYLWYDGHPGYDYGIPKGTTLLASADGKLFKATKDLVNSPRAANAWNKFHTFYIDHGNGYSSWYLHCNRLLPEIAAVISEKGYADVTQGQPIAKSGDYGTSGQNHLHFEVRKDGFDHANIIDPYKESLWE